jgi:glycosidase
MLLTIKKLAVLGGAVLTLAACKNNETAAPIVGADNDPAQYGTPFANVPEASDAAVYQVNFSAFSQAGTLQGIVPRLDSIKALGVNTLYLMPIYPIGQLKGIGSPYAVRDYQAVNPSLGNLNDLRAVVDAAHAKGMAVILDWVGNHTSWDHAWVNAHRDWYQQDANGTLRNPPAGFTDVLQLNFAKPDMRAAMIAAMRYWVLTANVDGYRFDYADGPTYQFFTEANTSLKSISGHKLLLIAEGSQRDYFFKSGFNLQYGFDFFSIMEKRIFGGQKSAKILDSLNTANYASYRGLPPTARMLRYTSNHDVNVSDGTPLDLFGGKAGSLAAFVVAAYMNGTPMVYNGQEVGTPQRLPFIQSRQVIDWSLNPDMVLAYKRILRFRNASNAVRNGALASYSTDDVCAFTKTADNEQVLTVINLRNRAVTYTVPAALVGSYRNGLTGQAAAVGTQVSLQPYQYLVLQK